MTGIIIAACAVGVTGLLLGLFLGFMGKKFAVEVDQKEIDVRAELPGNNCGGCGYAGCDALAKAIAAGEADCGACPVGGAPVAAKIAAIMGAEAGSQERMTAFVKCGGDCDKAKNNYVYSGVQDCTMMNIAPNGGPKGCTYGCMGYGSCVKTCPFDAIHVVNGVAVVDKEKCKACGKCVATCPRHLIELIPYKASYAVNCSSQNKGKDVMQVCSVGCIGCMLCTKQCEYGAITVENNIAHIDQSKCGGDCDKAKNNYVYSGVQDCTMMNIAPNGGPKGCTYGCMGYGSCVKTCPFDAIHVVNGVAVVDKEKCKACGKCVATCPRHLIELIPYKASYAVNCSSQNKGKDVMQVCSVGCIGCMLCTKQCEYGAITVENNIAHIDQSKCVGCGKCAEKCPKKIIHKQN